MNLKAKLSQLNKRDSKLSGTVAMSMKSAAILHGTIRTIIISTASLNELLLRFVTLEWLRDMKVKNRTDATFRCGFIFLKLSSD